MSKLLRLIACGSICSGLLPPVVRAAIVTFPGAAPCDTTLQACIDGTAAGATIQIGSETAIDESLTIAKTLTFDAAQGVAPVIGGTGTLRQIHLQDAGAGGGGVAVVMRHLTLANVTVFVDFQHGSGHAFELSDSRISSTAAAFGLDLEPRVPTTILAQGNVITTSYTPIGLFTMSSGSVSILGNQIRAATPASGDLGMNIDLAGSGTVTVDVESNVLHDVAGCACGNPGAIRIGARGTVVSTVNITNNTIDHAIGGDGIIVQASDAAELTVDLFNNTISRVGAAVVFPGASAQLVINSGFNNFFNNTGSAVLGGYSLGSSTLGVDPLFVDPANGNFRLQSESPLKDSGTNTPVGGLPALDADGSVRLAGASVDRGAYEFGSAPPTTTTLPPSCQAAATAASVACRLDALLATVQSNVPAGKLLSKLAALVGDAKTKTQDGGMLLDGGNAKAAKKAFARAGRPLGAFGRKLRSRAARGLTSGLRHELLSDERALAADLRTLRRGH